MSAATELLNAREAADVLRCGRSYLTDHAEEIGYVRRGGRLFFYRRDLEAWNQRHYVRPSKQRPAVPQSRPSLVAVGSLIDPKTGQPRMNPVTGEPYRIVS